jgi:hypothetical protein
VLHSTLNLATLSGVSPMAGITDDYRAAIERAAAPLAPAQRKPFADAVTAALADVPVIEPASCIARSSPRSVRTSIRPA